MVSRGIHLKPIIEINLSCVTNQTQFQKIIHHNHKHNLILIESIQIILFVFGINFGTIAINH